MQETIEDYTLRAYLRNPEDEWWQNEKLSDEWLDKIIPAFFKKINKSQELQNFGKGQYYKFINLLENEEIDPEITEKLNEIHLLLQ